MDKPSAKYEVIHSIVSQEGCLQNIKELCQIAGVSRSGYYNWLASEDSRNEKESRDQRDFELILEAYSSRGMAKALKTDAAAIRAVTIPAKSFVSLSAIRTYAFIFNYIKEIKH